MGLTRFPHGISSFGVPVLPGNQDVSGKTYFVDGNAGSDSNDGSTWEKAYKTLVVAFAASHADIAGTGASGHNHAWARRNTIFISGDYFVEDLVAFPQKTDVIGVGSCDGFKGAGIYGNHSPVNTALGTRFINVHFDSVTAGSLVTLTSACTGVEFIGCSFINGSAQVSAVKATASTWLKILDCDIIGSFTRAIDLAAGAINGTRIMRNTIIGAGIGIQFTGNTTITGGHKAVISDNHICTTGITIDDGADATVVISNNFLATDGAYGGTSHVITVTNATINHLTAGGLLYSVPLFTDQDA